MQAFLLTKNKTKKKLISLLNKISFFFKSHCSILVIVPGATVYSRLKLLFHISCYHLKEFFKYFSFTLRVKLQGNDKWSKYQTQKRIYAFIGLNKSCWHFLFIIDRHNRKFLFWRKNCFIHLNFDVCNCIWFRLFYSQRGVGFTDAWTQVLFKFKFNEKIGAWLTPSENKYS